MSNLFSLYFTPCRRCLYPALSSPRNVYIQSCRYSGIGGTTDSRSHNYSFHSLQHHHVRRTSLLSHSFSRWHSTIAKSDFHTEEGGVKSKGGASRTRGKKWSPHREKGWVLPEGYDTGIRIYNSMTNCKEPLILPRGKTASWYACGPTVYDHAHIGHASSYIRIDLLRRILENYFGIDVVLLMGVTDIDDKIIERSKELGIPTGTLCELYEKDFFRDMERLRVLPPTLTARVTEHVPQIVKFVQRIMDNGYAYLTPKGTVYFDVESYGRYGRLRESGPASDLREMIQVDSYKRSVRDFALWKPVKPGEPSWDSPWGAGRPGWHIECSTMASAIFGERLDIHSGGDDLKFPHHENELAQSEACFGCQQWTNYWVHTGYLYQRAQRTKMSKSLKNTISINALLKAYTPTQFRLFCMLQNYKTPIEYGHEQMQKAKSVDLDFINFHNTAKAYIRGDHLTKPLNEPYILECLQKCKDSVDQAFRDDFDTPRALNKINEMMGKINLELNTRPETAADLGVRSPGTVAAVDNYLKRFQNILGIDNLPSVREPASESYKKYDKMINDVVEFRKKVRAYALNPNAANPEDVLQSKEEKKEQRRKFAPLFEACDKIRGQLKECGINVQDLEAGTIWNYIPKADAGEDEKDSVTKQTSKSGQSLKSESPS